jgi:hypothetical protein
MLPVASNQPCGEMKRLQRGTSRDDRLVKAKLALRYLNNTLEDRRSTRKRVSEADPMSSKYRLSVHHRIKRKWAAGLKSLGGRIVDAAERALQGLLNQDRPLIPIPVRVADRRRLDRSRPQ